VPCTEILISGIVLAIRMDKRDRYMKKRELAALSTLFLMGTGIAIWVVTERNKARRKRDMIANAGYETAQDVLFPEKNWWQP